MIPPPSIPYPVQSHLRETVLKVARHEVGHMIAAKVVGFKTGGITIELTDNRGAYKGGAEIILPRPVTSLEEAGSYISDRVVVLWAGALAESVKDGKADQDAACACLNSGGGILDHGKARELLNLLRNIRFPSAQTDEEKQAGLTAIENEVWARAIAAVEAEEPLIVGMAGRVAHLVRMTATKYTLSEAEIAATPNIMRRFGAG